MKSLPASFSFLLNISLAFAFTTLLVFFVAEWQHSRTRRRLESFLWRRADLQSGLLRTSQHAPLHFIAASLGDEKSDQSLSIDVNVDSSTGTTTKAIWPSSLVKPSSAAYAPWPTTAGQQRQISSAPTNRYHVFVAIMSAPGYRERRDAARLIWKADSSGGQEQLRKKQFYRYAFVCGRTRKKEIHSKLLREASEEQDIVMAGEITDSYRELTHKVLWAMEWSLTNIKFNYFLKTDDDVFVNLSEFFIRVPWHAQEKVYIGCTSGRIGQGVRVKRQRNSKWYVPRSAYSKDFFPPYNQGHGYLLSRDVVEVCVTRARNHTLIAVEDAFIGLILSEVNIIPQHEPHIHDRINTRACQDQQALIIGGVQPQNLAKMAKNVQSGKQPCTKVL